jgi:hypothetical protein
MITDQVRREPGNKTPVFEARHLEYWDGTLRGLRA